MAKGKVRRSGDKIHHEMPVPDFFQAFGKTMLSQNGAIAGYVGKRVTDNIQTMLKMSVSANPMEAASAIAGYWQRVGRDNSELMESMLTAPTEVEREVKDLINSEARILDKGKEEVFENSPV